MPSRITAGGDETLSGSGGTLFFFLKRMGQQTAKGHPLSKHKSFFLVFFFFFLFFSPICKAPADRLRREALGASLQLAVS